MRQELRTWREECNEWLVQADREQSIRQYDSIVSWLKIDESDQMHIFHPLREDALTYPGTCTWVLNNKKMAAALQRSPEAPLLWVQGGAGTGKSVLASSLVNFMDRPGSLTLSHFCNYAYPSSTKYETILRSLLVQLVRKDQELAAHVYDSYVLAKKSPSIPILESLLKFMLASISKEPQQTTYLWICLDGIDECEALVRDRTLGLVSQVTSSTFGPENVICKALLFSRFSSSASTRLRKSQSISLSEEKEHVNMSIRRYAEQRLRAMYSKFEQMSLTTNDVDGIENAITEKADGKFSSFSWFRSR